jgi:glycerol-3-phosphate cytidylyltransferase
MMMNKKTRIGYTAGVFDLFHIGHLNILKKAKEHCDYLIVGVTTDELVSYKKKEAIIPFSERIKIVESIKYVDQVVQQENMDKIQAWEKYKFDVMFVGSDWKGTEIWTKYEKQFSEVGVEIIYFRYTQETSSTKLRQALEKITRSFPDQEDLKDSPSIVKMRFNLDELFIKKFKLKKLTIKIIGNWIISLRPEQPTIGSMVLTLNRKCETLAQITEVESLELKMAFVEIERILSEILNPDKINYLALMMVDCQVHFHIIPRYSKEILFEDILFADSHWPNPHSLDPIKIDQVQIYNLLKKLKYNTL